MGRLPGYRQVTLYIDPSLYAKVKCGAYTLDEDVYEFVSEALNSALKRRMTESQLSAVESMSRQNIKNSKPRRRRSSAL